MPATTPEQRFEDLEVKLAYQEHTVSELNDVVHRQQLQLDQLEQACRRLAERLQALADTPTTDPAGERPPHY